LELVYIYSITQSVYQTIDRKRVTALKPS
jgi:hypothetical protein